jgi:Cupredoxin-like domain
MTLRDDRFEPSTLEDQGPGENSAARQDAHKVAAEFESSELNREKVVPAGQSAVISIGPLSPVSQPTL